MPKFDPDKPVTWRGKPARIVDRNFHGYTHGKPTTMLLAVVMSDAAEGREATAFFNLDGRSPYQHQGEPLLNVPVKHRMWVNCYHDIPSAGHPTRADADMCCHPSRIACVEVEFEEGEGL